MDIKSPALGVFAWTPPSPRLTPGREVLAPKPPQVPRDEPAAEVAASPAEPERTLSITIDKETGKTVVHLIDVQNGAVIRQIPTEEMLATARALGRTHSQALRTKA